MGGFAGGLAAFGQGALGGYSAVQAIQLKNKELQQAQLQLDDQKRQLAAAAARYHGLDQGGGPQGPQSPQAGQPPAPPSMPGGTPMPQMGAGGPPQMQGPPGGGPPPMQGPRPMPQMGAPGGQPPMAPPGGGGGPPPMQGPPGGAPGPMPGGPPPGGAPTAMSGVAQPTGNPVQDMMQTWKSIALDIKARNPGIDDTTLGEAVDQQIKQLKQLDPSEAAFLRAQTAYYRAGVDLMKGQGADEARIQSAQIGADSRRDVATTGAKARVKAAGLGADARRYGADQGLKGREYAADEGLEGRKYAADQGRAGSDYRADQGRAGRENAADITARTQAAKAYLTAVTQGGTAKATPEQLSAAEQIERGGAMADAATRRPANRPQAQGGLSPAQTKAIKALPAGKGLKLPNGQVWANQNGKAVRIS